MIPYEFSAERFSRWMAYVLRHNPTRYGLTADRHGFVDLEAFLTIAGRRYPSVSSDRLRALIDEGDRNRFAVAGGRLRARYGHSIVVEPAGEPITPPERLYHGSDSACRERVMSDGVRPMDRRMVHLSATIDDALAVARHKTVQPLILRIEALAAHEAGVVFYRESAVFLVAHVPAQFVGIESVPKPSEPSSEEASAH